MSLKYCFILLGVGLCSSVGIVKRNIQAFTAERNFVKQGDQIVLTCNYDTTSSIEIVKFHKIGSNKSVFIDDEIETQVSDSRFKIEDVDKGNNNFAKVLTIERTVSGDSGNYSCDFHYKNNVKPVDYWYLNITVEVEPQTIRFFLDDNEAFNGSQTELKPLNAFKLRCETTGSNPQANISIMSGIRKLTPTNISSISRYGLQDPDYEFVLPIEYNTTANFNHWIFGPDSFLNPVMCVAKVNKDSPGISTMFNPVIKDGPPLFECNDTVYVASGQKNFVISCNVYAKPILTSASFVISTGKFNESINGMPWNQTRASTDGNYRGVVIQGEIKSFMNITIGLTDTQTAVTISFGAKNAYAENVHSVTLLGQEKKISLATSVKSVATLLIALLCLSAFLIRP